MKANVLITKSFDGAQEFSKVYEAGDFEEFFMEEGKYLDRLSDGVNTHGDEGEGFRVTYSVTLSK